MLRLLWVGLAVLLVGCGEAVFLCSGSDDCAGGFCEPNGYCSFGDPSCPSGQRYGEFAGGGLANMCTPVGDDGTDVGTGDSTGSLESSTSGPGTSVTLTSATSATSITSSTTETTMSVDDSSTSEAPGTTWSESSGGSSSSTGLSGPFMLSFGDRGDADVQGVTADTDVRAGQAGENFGGHDDVHISGSVSDVALVRIDVSDLPAGAQVSEAVLHIWNQEVTSNGEIEVFAVAESWVEGANNGGDGLCNWDYREEGVLWTTAGVGDGSYVDDVLDTMHPDVMYEEFTIPIPADLVEQWRDDPDTNFGLVFRAQNLDTTIWLGSSECKVESERPLLVVTYYE